MSDREEIAEAIWRQRAANELGGPISEWSEIHDRYREDFRREADGVLAAIGDRLMPEHESWVETIHLARKTKGSPNWAAIIWITGWGQRTGTGPTIPAAIANALEGQS